MDAKEKLRFVVEARVIVGKLKQWLDDHDSVTPEEREALARFKLELQRLKQALNK